MLTTTSRRYVVATTIGSFSVAALLGIAALLGSELGDTQGRVLLTTLVVGLASLAVLCYVSATGTAHAVVGTVGCVAVLVPLATSLSLIWGEGALDGSEEAVWRLFGVGVVVAGTLAQACLLLTLSLGAGWQCALRRMTLAVAVLLGLVLCGLILSDGDGGDGIYRVIGVLAILDVFGTIVGGLMALGGRLGGTATTPAHGGSHRSVMLPAELVEQVERHAARVGRSPSDLVAEAVDAHLAARDTTQSGT